MIAASGDPGKNDEVGNGQWYAPQRGWNSDMWSHMNETDDNQEDL